MDQLKVGALLSYIALAINIIVGLLYTPWMINSIGKEDYGLYTLALSVISIFVFDFGISHAVTRFVAKHLAEGSQEKANNCLGLVYKLYIYIDIIIFFVLVSIYFFIPQIYRELTPNEIEKFKIIYVIVSLFSVISFPFIPVNGILTAAEKFIQLKFCDLIHKLFIVATMSVCLLMGFGLYALVLINVIAGLLTILLKLLFIKKDTNISVNFLYENKIELREILQFSGWVTIKSLAARMIFTLSPSIIAMVSGSVEVALFGVVNVIEGYVYSFSSAISGLFLPRVYRLNSHEEGDVMPLMIKVGRILLIIIAFIIVVFVSIGHQFLTLWLGEGFEKIYWSVVLVILPSIIYIPHEIGFCAIDVQNKVKYQAIVFVAMSVVNIIIGYFLASKYGCLGICISIFIAYSIRNIGIDYIMKKNLQLDISRFFMEVFGNSLGYILVTLLICIAIGLLPIKGWGGLCVKVLGCALVYFSLVYSFVLNSDEHMIVKSIFKLRCKK